MPGVCRLLGSSLQSHRGAAGPGSALILEVDPVRKGLEKLSGQCGAQGSLSPGLEWTGWVEFLLSSSDPASDEESVCRGIQHVCAEAKQAEGGHGKYEMMPQTS